MEIQIKDKSFEIVIANEKIQRRVCELAVQISKDYQGKELLFIPVLNGAFLFSSDLIKEITIPCQISFIKVSSYSGIESSGTIKELIGLNLDLSDKHVLLVDDIVDTGLTMSTIMQEISKLQPASVEVVSLLLKPEALQKNLNLKYVGFTIPNSFVVGYGLDYNGYGRNLKDIYHIKN
jgi:hypoxanthine phosphoribosyltransferase